MPPRSVNVGTPELLLDGRVGNGREGGPAGLRQRPARPGKRSGGKVGVPGAGIGVRDGNGRGGV